MEFAFGGPLQEAEHASCAAVVQVNSSLSQVARLREIPMSVGDLADSVQSTIVFRPLSRRSPQAGLLSDRIPGRPMEAPAEATSLDDAMEAPENSTYLSTVPPC